MAAAYVIGPAGAVGYPDGITRVAYPGGALVDLPESLGASFVALGLAEPDPAATPAPRKRTRARTRKAG